MTIKLRKGGGSIQGTTSRTGSGAFISGAAVTISAKAFGDPNDAVRLETVSAHEFGHVLGLGHANGTGLLMSPYLDPLVTGIRACDEQPARTALDWYLSDPFGDPVAPLATHVCA